MKSNKIGLICLLSFIGAILARAFDFNVVYVILLVVTGVTVIAFQDKIEQEAKEKHNKG